jgi:hypothetical protein
MHKQDLKTDISQFYELTDNNSKLTLKDGSVYRLDIQDAILNLCTGDLPEHIKLEELHQHTLMISDFITQNLPDDVDVPMYKSMKRLLDVQAAFFHSLFKLQKGGDND